ncbi:glycyl-radical enzyme activating protein [Spirochaetia bacterium]|nr:glycyl-radical enzyme activating protein [Spirochaetia bacterium]
MGTNELRAKVFNIERFATEDGPGIRTVIFLKGCALRCRWCANPESQSFDSQILFNGNMCTSCARCVEVCPRKGIEYYQDFGFITTNAECDLCGTCVKNCFFNARTISGEWYTREKLASEVLRDEGYYRQSGGGITFSGGEPLFYHSFIREFALLMKKRGIGSLIETCGHVPLEYLQNVADVVDIIYFDFKHIDSDRHLELTGADNHLILSNLAWLSANFTGFLAVRYPYIPGCNDDIKDVRKFIDHISKVDNVAEVWFLPYHRLGIAKYKGLGRPYLMEETQPLRMKDIDFLKNIGAEYGLNVRI